MFVAKPLYATFPDGGTTETVPAEAAPVKPKTPRKKAAKKPKAAKKSEPKAKPKAKKNPAKKAKAKKTAKRKPSAKKSKVKKAVKTRNGGPERSERLDMRLTRAEKNKLNAKAKARGVTLTVLIIDIISKLK